MGGLAVNGLVRLAVNTPWPTGVIPLRHTGNRDAGAQGGFLGRQFCRAAGMGNGESVLSLKKERNGQWPTGFPPEASRPRSTESPHKVCALDRSCHTFVFRPKESPTNKALGGSVRERIS